MRRLRLVDIASLRRHLDSTSLFAYHRYIDSDKETLDEFNRLLAAVEEDAGIPIDNRLGMWAALLERFHKTVDTPSETTKTIYKLFLEMATRTEIAHMNQCWSVVEMLTWYYRDIENEFDKIIRFTNSNIHMAPVDAHSNFDALMRGGSADSRIVELILRHYVLCSGTSVRYDDFIKHADHCLSENKKKYGDHWWLPLPDFEG